MTQLSSSLDGAAHNAVPPPVTPRAYTCVCGRPIFFRNSFCLGCQTPLGYDPERRVLLPLASLEAEGRPWLWRRSATQDVQSQPIYQRCMQLDTPSACNWLIEYLPAPDATPDAPAGASPTPRQCRCCELLRMLPDLSLAENALWFKRIELARRRLVSSLIGLALPVGPRRGDAPPFGMAFDLLRSLPGAPKVLTGHDDGVITVDVEEADDSTREQRRNAMRETYRTLLGHLRHETGHYYWQRLVDGTPWLAPYRALFGDEQQDYAAALARHYRDGPPPDWGARHVSAYASSHPWEDWAETWAHYLHMCDTLDTARSFGIDGAAVELNYEPYGPDVVLAAGLPDDDGNPAHDSDFAQLLNSWMELTGVLNELSRSMGVPDFYPFVLSAPAARKLNFIHRVVSAAPQGPSAPPPVQGTPLA